MNENVEFIHPSVEYSEQTAQALEQAAERVRKQEFKLALCTFIDREGNPTYIIRGSLHQPQECLAASGLLNYMNQLVMKLMDRLMTKAAQEDSNGKGAN